MVLARAKGLPTRMLKYRHVGRNSLLPLVSSLGAFAGLTVGPALFVEAVFTYPGMGTLLSDAVTARDYPLLQGGFLMLGIAVLVVNFLLDLAYQWLDPRVAR
jgi:peptide/nickel transport system permease protein